MIFETLSREAGSRKRYRLRQARKDPGRPPEGRQAQEAPEAQEAGNRPRRRWPEGSTEAGEAGSRRRAEGYLKHFPGEMEPEPVPDPGSRAAVQIHSGAAAGMLEPEPEAVAGSVAVVVLLPEAGAGAGSRGRIHPPELEPGPEAVARATWHQVTALYPPTKLQPTPYSPPPAVAASRPDLQK